MIQVIFGFAGEKVLIKVDNHNVIFGSTQNGAQMATIEGIRLDYAGVCREHPDLETHDDWRGEAIKRFKKKIKSLKTEEEIADYLIEDLSKFGYTPEQKQKNGSRPEVIK